MSRSVFAGSENRYIRVCLSKIPHVDPDFAREEAERMSRKDGHLVTAYHCPYCGQWHTGGDRGWDVDAIGIHKAKKREARHMARRKRK